MGGDNTGQILVQITSVSGHDLKGMMTAAFNSEQGKVGGVSLPFTGTIDSNLVTFNVETGRELKLFTGTLTGDGLALTSLANGNATKWNLKRGDAGEFADRVQGVRVKAAELKQAADVDAANQADAKHIGQQQDRIAAFAADIGRKSDAMSDGIARLNQITASYGSTIARANAGLHQRGMLAGFNHDRIIEASTSDHQFVRDAVQTFEKNVPLREQQALGFQSLCNANGRLNCEPVVTAMASYRVRAAQFRIAANEEDAAFAAIRSKLNFADAN